MAESKPKRLSRRDFLRLAVVGGAGGLALKLPRLIESPAAAEPLTSQQMIQQELLECNPIRHPQIEKRINTAVDHLNFASSQGLSKVELQPGINSLGFSVLMREKTQGAIGDPATSAEVPLTGLTMRGNDGSYQITIAYGQIPTADNMGGAAFAFAPGLDELMTTCAPPAEETPGQTADRINEFVTISQGYLHDPENGLGIAGFDLTPGSFFKPKYAGILFATLPQEELTKLYEAGYSVAGLPGMTISGTNHDGKEYIHGVFLISGSQEGDGKDGNWGEKIKFSGHYIPLFETGKNDAFNLEPKSAFIPVISKNR